MDLHALKARLAELARSIDAIEVASELHASARNAIAAQLEGFSVEADGTLAPAVREAAENDLRDDLARLYRSLAIANSWLEGRQQRSRDWIDRAAELAMSDVLRDMIQSEQNRLRDGEAFAGIRALCQQGQGQKARRQLLKRRNATSDAVMRKRIDEFLAEPRNFLGPLGSAPSMFTLNGFGTMLWGERARKPDGSYIATLCLVFVFLPIIPLRSYLVARENNGWRFYGRVPLSPFASWWRRLVILGPVLFGLAIWGVEAYENSPSLREERALSKATESAGRRDYAAALKALGPLAWSTDAGRCAKRDELSNTALLAALNDVNTPPDGAVFLAGPGAAILGLKPAFGAAASEAARSALLRIAAQPDSAKVVQKFIAWLGSAAKVFNAQQPDLALRACAVGDDPSLLAATADLFRAASRPCPPKVLTRLSAHLLKTPHLATWDADALSYLLGASADDSKAILQSRVENPWKGSAPGQDLLALASLPAPLRGLLAADGEENVEKRAAALEKAVESPGLQEPERSWHRLGVARRLAKAYGQLNETDPVRWPIAKAHPWAVEAAELAPGDADTRLTALRFLIQDGDFARAISLGTPSVQEERTALLVGIALARSGKPADAAKLLRPLVDRDLEAYTQGVQQCRDAAETKTENTWRSLEKGTAGHGILSRLKSLPKDKAQQEASRWVDEQVQRDPSIASLSAKVKKLGDIHPAASELAMIELELGQALPKGAERQSRLEAAEHLFLELRKALSNDPNQELQLGQVYFWLGKDKEGAEIYAKLEEKGDAALLSKMGHIYRSLSRDEAARRVLEQGYAKADDAIKMDIAFTRALVPHSIEDRLAWLKKANQKSSRVKFEIDQAEAEEDMDAGKYAEAAQALQRVAAYYAGQPEVGDTLNNASVVQYALARATGDPKYQMEALRLVRRSHEKTPEDGIVLSNYVYALEGVGIAALSGDSLRPDLLHALPDERWLDFVEPQPSPEELAGKARMQPELRRSAELGARAMVLSPDGSTGYQAQVLFYTLTRDGASMRRLREQVESRPEVHQEDEDAEGPCKGPDRGRQEEACRALPGAVDAVDSGAA